MLCALMISAAIFGQNLQVEDLKVGKGPAAKTGDVLTMLYKGTLTDKSVFDENLKGRPFAFKLGAGTVIQGWEKGLIGIREGGKRKLTIPASLGYGARSTEKIPANSTLIFEVVALRIEAANAKQAVAIHEIRPGSGAAAKSGQTVKVHYKGTFLNGFEFDSSLGRMPLEVALGQGMVIPGFEQGIIGMKKDGKRKVTIPYTLAYGAEGRPPVIPAYSTLVFELELISVK